MGVLVPFQRRIAAGIHLEIAQFAGQGVVVEQHLAGDVLERRAAVLLVRLMRHAVPAEVLLVQAGSRDVCSMSIVSILRLTTGSCP